MVLNLDEGRQYNEKIYALYKQYGLVVHCSYFGSRLLPCTSYYFLGVGSMKYSWWSLTIQDYPNYQPNDIDLEHIAEMIKQGYDNGQLVQEVEGEDVV